MRKLKKQSCGRNGKHNSEEASNIKTIPMKALPSLAQKQAFLQVLNFKSPQISKEQFISQRIRLFHELLKWDNTH